MGVSKKRLVQRFPSLDSSSDEALRTFVHSTRGGWWLGVVARIIGPLFMGVLAMALCAIGLLLLLGWGLRSKVLDDSTDTWMVIVVLAAAVPVASAFVAWSTARRRMLLRRVGDVIAEGGGPEISLPRGFPKSVRARRRYVVELVAMAAVAVAPFVWAGAEWAMTCAESRHARAVKPGAAGLNKLIATLPRAQGKPGEAVWLTFAGLWKAVDDVEERVWKEMGSPTYSNGNRLSPAYVNIGLDPAKVPEERRAEFVLEQQMAERMLPALESAGVFDTVAGVVGNSNVDVGVPAFTNDQAIAQFPRDGVSVTRKMLRFNIGRMALAIREKNKADFEDAFRAHCAAARLLEREPYGISRATAVSMDSLANAMLLRLLMSHPDRSWLELVDTLLNEASPRVPLTYTVEAERLYEIDRICYAFYDPETVVRRRLGLLRERFKEGRDRRLGSLDENLAFVNGRYEYLLKQLAKPRSERTYPVRDKFELVLHDFGSDATWSLVRGVEWAELDRVGLTIVCAVEKFNLAHGRSPATLNELVPEQLKSVPLDPLGGRPFSYKLIDPAKDPHGRSYLVYIWGNDNVDDGGKEPRRYYDAIVPPTQKDMDYIINYVDAY
ncbi:MAG: hypothetical protein QM783_15555 [Phycisphaerales bacterium]